MTPVVEGVDHVFFHCTCMQMSKVPVGLAASGPKLSPSNYSFFAAGKKEIIKLQISKSNVILNCRVPCGTFSNFKSHENISLSTSMPAS